MPPYLAKYRKHLASFGLNEAREEEIIHMIYNSMDNFVSRAFKDDPTQVCIEGQVVKNALTEPTVLASEDHVDVPNNLSVTFNTTKGNQ